MQMFKLNALAKTALVCLAVIIAAPHLTIAQTPAAESADTVARRPVGFEGTNFDGEVLPVFYVRDVLASVAFYVDTLGFVCHHYFDHINGGSVFEWTYDEPPIYAEMRAGNQKFALHQASNPDSLVVGGTRHYFGVTDVREHHRKVAAMGVKVGDLIERPWMHMYRVVDPDGHELFIFTRPPEDTTENK